MKHWIGLLLAAALLIGAVGAAWGQVYTWVDRDGVIRFADLSPKPPDPALAFRVERVAGPPLPSAADASQALTHGDAPDRGAAESDTETTTTR